LPYRELEFSLAAPVGVSRLPSIPPMADLR
jgi:hypothetical protein